MNKKKIILFFIVILVSSSVLGSTFEMDTSSMKNLSLTIRSKESFLKVGSLFQLYYTLKNNGSNTLQVACLSEIYETNQLLIFKNKKKINSIDKNCVLPKRDKKDDLKTLNKGEECSFEIEGKLKKTKLMDLESGKIYDGIFLEFENSAIPLKSSGNYQVQGSWLVGKDRILSSPIDIAIDLTLDSKTEEEIKNLVEIASQKAIELGYQLKDRILFFTDDNSLWKQEIESIEDLEFVDKLNRHDFLAVFFRPKKDEDNNLWIFVDRKTKRIIAVRNQ